MCRVGSVARLLSTASLVLGCTSNIQPAVQPQDAIGIEVVPSDRVICTSSCDGRQCGDDGCGGSCGDCDKNLQCADDGTCQPFGCSSSLDCPGELVCDESTGHCVVCVGTEDCPEGKFCGPDHECHLARECASDIDCKDIAMVCDKDSGQCVHCLKSSHCSDSEYCLLGFCVADQCIAEEVFCDENAVMICEDDGSRWTISVACGETQYCDQGACFDLVCAPSSIWCDGELALTCGADGTEIVKEEDCSADGRHCFEGECIDQVCVPEAIFCLDASTAAVCLDSGDAFDVEPCAPEHFCDSGQCLPWVCVPSTKSCSGPVAELCDDVGSAVVSDNDCSSQELVCEDGECVEQGCVPECQDKACGPDYCGGVCGACEDGQVCIAGQCPPPDWECDDGNESDWDGCTNGKLSEFVVNDHVQGSQAVSSVAGRSEGQFVAASSGAGTGDNNGIYVRAFAADGSPLGGDLPVNVHEGDDQVAPRIAALSTGHYVVVWTSWGQDASTCSGFGRLLNNSGMPVGGEFPVNSTIEGGQAPASVVSLGSAGFVVAWASKGFDDSAAAVVFQLFDNEATKIGPEHQANVFATGSQSEPSLAPLEPVGFAVAWMSQNFDGSGYGIMARLFDTDGSATSDETLVNATTLSDQMNPACAGLQQGGLFVSWQSHGGQDGDGKGVFGQSFNGAIEPVGGEFQVNEESLDDQTSPALATLTDGTVVVVWSQSNGDPDLQGIAVRRFDSAAQPLTNEAMVNVHLSGLQTRPSVASLGPTGYVVLWDSDGQDGDGYAVCAQRFDLDGNRLYH